MTTKFGLDALDQAIWQGKLWITQAWFTTRTVDLKADSTGHRNTPFTEVKMTTAKRKSERSTRRKLCSPGRPPVWQSENLCRFWRGIAAALSSKEAGVEAGVSATVGSRWFRSSGGMAPIHLVPSASQPKGRNLSFAEREEIALECARKTGVCFIARKLGRSPGTISREIRRNSATRGGDFDYRATTAQRDTDRAAQRPKASKLANNPALRD